MDNILAAAQAIAAARRGRTPLNSLDTELAPQDEADGYRIQRAVHEHASAKWVEKEELRHRDLMKEAGFLAQTN